MAHSEDQDIQKGLVSKTRAIVFEKQKSTKRVSLAYQFASIEH